MFTGIAGTLEDVGIISPTELNDVEMGSSLFRTAREFMHPRLTVLQNERQKNLMSLAAECHW